MRRSIVVPCALLLAFLARPASAAGQGAGTLSGTVTAPGGAGVPGARGRVVGTGRSAITAPDGRYRIGGVPAGAHTGYNGRYYARMELGTGR